MTPCSNCHTETETRDYKRFIGNVPATLCASCAATLQAMGMALTLIEERRETNLTPIRERRQPAWLARLTARDESGRMSA